MNIKNLFIYFLFILPVFANKSLILVKDLGDVKYDIPVLAVINNDNFIVLGNKKTTDILKQKQYDISVLDNSVEGKKYFLVYPFFEVPGKEIRYSVEILSKYGAVLADFSNVCLMISDVDKLHSIQEYTVDIVQLFLDPMDFNCNTITDPGKRGTNYDQSIRSMLKKVDPDTVEAYQRKLVSFRTRNVFSKCSKEEFIPWLAEFYENHGCDTILKFPLPSAPGAFEIVGVRYGRKEPTLENVIILGGHADVVNSGADPEIRHQGANDNATGQVAVMEACRVHSYFTFDKTILYAAHNGEEMGLWGSYEIVRWLKSIKARTYGGIFSYDMFGMEAGSEGLTFSVWTGLGGSQAKEAQLFVDKMKDIKEQYGLKQPQRIQTIPFQPEMSDFMNYQNAGYLCLSHNFSTAGAGQKHTIHDVMKDTYDKVFQAECAKMGIIVTAEYAGISPIGIKNRENKMSNSHFKYFQINNHVIFNFNNNTDFLPGKLEIFSPDGKLLRSFKINSSEKIIVWNRTNNNGVRINACSLVIVKYSTSLMTASFKMVIR